MSSSSQPSGLIAPGETGTAIQALPYRSWVEVSRPQIAANFRAIRKLVGDSVEIAPVVKADAYRHGAVEVSRTLESEGAGWLAVSNTDEGIALRDAGIHARILVMADFLPFTREAMLAYQLTPVIHTLEDLAELDRLACARQEKIRYHLKIDSGLGRLGVSANALEIANAISAARNVQLEGLMTHFASAANYKTRQTEEQIAVFENVVRVLREGGIAPPYVHLSATVPVAYGRRKAWGQMIRPGHAIYGYVSPVLGHGPQKLLRVAPALNWRASVLQVKEIAPGTSVGYGAIFTATERMRVAVIAAGYADGIPHRLSNRGSVIVNGRRSAILGAVSMDMTCVDVTHAPELRVGHAVTLLGSEGKESIDALEIAKLAQTISHNVLCGIHARVKRVYV